MRAYAIRFGSLPTCTTPQRITTIQIGPCIRISSRSGNSFPGLCMRGPGRRLRWNPRSVRMSPFTRPRNAAQGDNLAPCYGLQFFGHTVIDGGASGALTVTLKDVEDRALWSITLDPASTD